MRIHLQDFCGHPFQVQLSRGLAGRGHEVSHTYAGQYTTGRGRLLTEPTDPVGLSIAPLTVEAPFDKYSPKGRFVFERAYCDALIRLLEREQPEVLITANVPLFVIRGLTRYTRSAGLPWILWHQDIVSLAIGDEAARRLPRPTVPVVRRLVERIEKRALRQAAAVVPIGEAFVAQYDRWGLALPNVSVIPNWAPLDEIYPCPRDNAWAAEQDLRPDAVRLVYAGTLGRKHNPDLLVDLVAALTARAVDVELVVVSEGDGADHVAARTQGMPNVHVLPFQSVQRLPEVLSSADVLLTLLEPEASTFSVPSKVLSYLAAGRPVLGFVPQSNPCADDILAAGGLIVPPDAAGTATAAAWVAGLAGDEDRIVSLGTAARDLAERKFDVEKTVDRFVALAEDAVGRQVSAV